MSKIWCVCDTHWNHPMLIQHGYRPLDYEQQIVRNWQRQVGPDDFLIHLGDVIMRRASELKAILAQLPGHKILTVGNHDRHPTQWYLDSGFDFVCSYFVSDGIIFTHRPLATLPAREGFSCTMNVCGHVHNTAYADLPIEDMLPPAPWRRVLSLEQMKYSPRLLSEIIAGQWCRQDFVA
jgi:calcineurin-like phosphoesterase family protein